MTNKRTMNQFLPMVFAIVGLVCSGLLAQDSDDIKSELGEKQRLVEQKMVDLENMFTVIAAKLQDKEPERAKQLVDAYQQAKEQLITKKMAEVSEHLDNNQYEQAAQKIDEVIQKLDDLVRLLMNDKSPKMTKSEEIDMLEDWKNSIQQMRQSQNQQRRETEKVANKDETLRKIDQQIKQLEDLIGQQKGLIDQTSKSDGAGIRTLDKIADQQFEIRKKTEDLASEIADGDEQPVSTDANDAKPGDSKPGDSKPGDSKPGDSKPGDSKPGDSKPGDSKPGDSKPGDSSRVIPSRVIPSRVIPNRVIPNRVIPNRVIPNRVIPNRVIPNRVIPNHLHPTHRPSQASSRCRNQPNISARLKKNWAALNLKRPNSRKSRLWLRWKTPSKNWQKNGVAWRLCLPRHLTKWQESKGGPATRQWRLSNR